ncbi:DNA repair protein XRCC1 [Hyla sarda]|uniref:DNA repair protein XRCC1 n=1 Tax=Hyla sarda TaxID=327740 RepID=UPI0024C25191|nr:DNA repair protein XRCC1 [Hyla sarda]XP_056399138.1 DNA repair protein XRCC1 [Hyla sarda]XP_056399139.1 DNA repair protein XRCC1 [Hyla sarda]
MPEIKLKHVVSCSSADTTHTAENLLKPDTYRKWKAQHVGEKQISVILQLEKEEQIHSIDIGNEGSAFVEVLVGHSTSVSEQEYEVILGMSSFMSPSESKNGSNLNRMRMFGPDKLVKAAAEKKWDRVKIVCTQPYTKNLAYGLSFIRFHSPPDKDDPPPSSPKVTKLGQFKVKEEESSSPSMRPGALFFSRANKTEVTPPKAPQTSYAAVALQGTSSTDASSEKQITKTPPSNTAPKDPSSGKRKFELKKEPSSHPPTKVSPSHSKESNSQPPPKKIKAEPQTPPPVKKTPPQEKPSHKKTPPSSQPVEMNRILQGTVFVLSGFQNPFRSDLRDKALEMGAKYRPDWTPDSTHLICAFANTPKYSQVKAAGGIIVRKEWILDCHRKKQRLPYKKYLMDGADSSSEEDEDSEEDSPPRQKPPAHRPKPDPGRANHKNQSSPAKAKPARATVKEESEEEEEKPSVLKKEKPIKQEVDFGGSTDEDMGGDRCQDDDSGGDTEDELRKIEDQKQTAKKEQRSAPDDDPYAGSTDENTDVEEEPEINLPIPELPDLFVGKHFFLYGEFPPAERRLLQRYITAFNGELEEYMNEKVQFVITAQEWDDSFEEALNDNASLHFVRPRWIYNCNERQKCIPHQPYVVVPQA